MVLLWSFILGEHLVELLCFQQFTVEWRITKRSYRHTRTHWRHTYTQTAHKRYMHRVRASIWAGRETKWERKPKSEQRGTNSSCAIAPNSTTTGNIKGKIRRTCSKASKNGKWENSISHEIQFSIISFCCSLCVFANILRWFCFALSCSSLSPDMRLSMRPSTLFQISSFNVDRIIRFLLMQLKLATFNFNNSIVPLSTQNGVCATRTHKNWTEISICLFYGIQLRVEKNDWLEINETKSIQNDSTDIIVKWFFTLFLCLSLVIIFFLVWYGYGVQTICVDKKSCLRYSSNRMNHEVQVSVESDRLALAHTNQATIHELRFNAAEYSNQSQRSARSMPMNGLKCLCQSYSILPTNIDKVKIIIKILKAF